MNDIASVALICAAVYIAISALVTVWICRWPLVAALRNRLRRNRQRRTPGLWLEGSPNAPRRSR